MSRLSIPHLQGSFVYDDPGTQDGLTVRLFRIGVPYGFPNMSTGGHGGRIPRRSARWKFNTTLPRCHAATLPRCHAALIRFRMQVDAFLSTIIDPTKVVREICRPSSRQPSNGHEVQIRYDAGFRVATNNILYLKYAASSPRAASLQSDRYFNTNSKYDQSVDELLASDII
ncbi:hypothetical protein K504DRAFT_531503 [Pleomassaria siparia CBS 279.74]|uniref:Uncharacterized protein n=1 Tax=Pleomassaria siparia CBS 279.74 TaxID=1314801 RepID=A0A6G1KJ58_9PLEO|nr:hypothetical protein K504DRAFT_531503 [Pleomassaria siparia CBS 279.74]